MSALLVSTGLVALAEIGDKTQLLALLLAARYQRPWPIVLGILAATLANHAAAGSLGAWLSGLIDAQMLRWILGVGFLAMAAWMLVPDSIDAEAVDRPARSALAVFGVTTLLFFVAEIGDKTQIATVALAAHYRDLVSVVIGTTVGMMLANAPAVWLGDKFANRLQPRLVHRIAAAIFATLGVLALLGIGS